MSAIKRSAENKSADTGKKRYGWIIKTAGFLLFVILIYKLLEFLLVPPTEWGSFKEIYSGKEKWNTIYLGSSHSYNSIDPNVMDRELSTTSFNLGTSDQALDGSLFLLKEALKYHPVKTVYLEMYFKVWLEGGHAGALHSERDDEDMTNLWVILDNTRFSPDKAEYFLNASSSDYYVPGALSVRRYWRKLLNLAEIKENVKNRLEYEEPEEYKGRGYFGSKNKLGKSLAIYGFQDTIEEDMFSGDNYEDLKELVKLCKDRDIELILYCSPVNDVYLMNCGYASYVRQLKEFAEENELCCYDFNLARKEYLDLEFSDFRDYNHLNTEGAAKFMELLISLRKGEVTAGQVFYGSYEEKLETEDEQIYGINFLPTESFEVMEVKIQSNIKDTGRLRTEIKYVTDEGEEIRCSDEAGSTDFLVTMPVNEGRVVPGNVDVTVYLDEEKQLHVKQHSL